MSKTKVSENENSMTISTNNVELVIILLLIVSLIVVTVSNIFPALIVPVIIVGVLVTVFVYIKISKSIYIIDSKGIAVKNKFSSLLIPWSEIDAISMVCISEEWRYQARSSNKTVTLPFTTYMEKVEEFISKYGGLVEVNVATVGLATIKRWSKKGITYHHTSTLDRINDIVFK